MFYRAKHARKMAQRLKLGIVSIAALGTMLSGVALAGPANAAVPVTGTTWLPGNIDSGNGSALVHGLVGGWAIDAFHRILTVTADPSACSHPVFGLTCFTATISDAGKFTTLPGNGHAPNPNSTTDPSNNIAWPPVAGTFSGSASYVFQTSATPAVSNIPNVVNNGGVPPAIRADSTSDWFVNAFASATSFDNSAGLAVMLGGTNDNVLQNNWTWSYTTYTGASATTTAVACEHWTDSFANGSGATALDGNVTGQQCAGTPVPISQGNLGDEVNGFGNGFDVFQQHFAYNAVIAGWTATKGDPATRFIKIPDNAGWQFEAVNGKFIATGLCVSDPGAPDNLVLRHCGVGNPWQEFIPQSDGTLKDMATGLFVNPNGTGAPLTGGITPTPWGGSKYSWMDLNHLP